FLLLTGYFFYSDLALFVLVGGANQTRGLWRFVFLDFRLVALLVVPLLTMRLFAEERKQGTLELLWTFPVRDGEVLAGKVLAAIGARIAPALLQLSLFDHFYGFAQGVIDSRDVVYLLAFAALFLFLAHRSLGARAWRGL